MGKVRHKISKRDKRYPPNWSDLSDFTISISMGRCCLCFWRQATLAHHAYYPPYWLQLPWICLFPVCRKCHGVCHRKENWNLGSDESKQDDHNTICFLFVLQFKFALLLTAEALATAFVLVAITELLP